MQITMVLAAVLLSQSATETDELRASLAEWRSCMQRYTMMSDSEDPDTIFGTAYADCLFEQERYRKAVVNFAPNALPLAEVSAAADEMVDEKRALFRSELGERVASDVATRRFIRRYARENRQRTAR